MTLYVETVNGDFQPWTGQPVSNGSVSVRHPLNIETAWTAQQLAAWKLYAPVSFPVPAGKQISSRTVARIGGVVKYVDVYEDIPAGGPENYPLSDRQLRLGLIMNGISLEIVDAAIDSIADPIQKAVAKVWWDRSTSIEWNHVMTQTMLQLVGITKEQASLMWMAAKNISA